MLTQNSTDCNNTTGTVFTWVLMKQNPTAGDVEWEEAGRRRNNQEKG